MTKIRTRYAPSPTGKMHVGNLRSALYEFLIAKHVGGDFMLRIEDTDQERFVEGATEIIYRTLEKTMQQRCKHEVGKRNRLYPHQKLGSSDRRGCGILGREACIPVYF